MEKKDVIGILQVERIAALAKLDFSDAEKREILSDMNDIIIFASKLAEIDEKEEKYADAVPLESLREDTVEAGLQRSSLTSFAQTSCDGFISVPRVIGEGE